MGRQVSNNILLTSHSRFHIRSNGELAHPFSQLQVQPEPNKFRSKKDYYCPDSPPRQSLSLIWSTIQFLQKNYVSYFGSALLGRQRQPTAWSARRGPESAQPYLIQFPPKKAYISLSLSLVSVMIPALLLILLRRRRQRQVVVRDDRLDKNGHRRRAAMTTMAIMMK